MSTIVSWNGSSFTVPQTGEENWGGVTKVDGLLVSLANNGLQKTGGLFTLSADVDLGGTAGLQVAYIKSRTTPISTAGLIRLARTDTVGWRNAADSANLLLGVDPSNNLVFNGSIITSSSGVVPVGSGGTGITSYTAGDMIYASGAATLSKLALGAANTVLTSTGSSPPVWAQIVNANVSNTAAIAYSKLTLTGSIVNADVNASAAIALSKLATVTASRALVSDGSGLISVSAVTSTELGFVAGLTSSAVGTTQTQSLSAKTFTDAITLTQIATPSTPGAGLNKLYTKSGDTLNWLDSSGTEHVAIDAQSSAYQLRNFIINGNMDLWQRSTSQAGITVFQYVADRWLYNIGGSSANVTISRSSDVPTLAQSGFQSAYSHYIDVTTADAAVAAGDVVLLEQKIEGYLYQQLKNRTVTLSFWVKSTKTGTFCVAFQNSGADRSYVVEYTVSVTNTWEKKTITVTLNPSGGTDNFENSVGLYVAFCLMGGSTYQTTANAWQNGNFFCTSNQVNAMDSTSNDWRIAQVCLNLGSTAIAFTRFGGDFGGELRACQRYYEKSYDHDVNPGSVVTQGAQQGFTGGTTRTRGDSIFKVTKRSTPTMTAYSTNGPSGNFRNASAGADIAVGTVTVGNHAATWESSATVVVSDRILWFWVANAEL